MIEQVRTPKKVVETELRRTRNYTFFVIDSASRRGQIVGSTPHPDELFMRQVVAS